MTVKSRFSRTFGAAVIGIGLLVGVTLGAVDARSVSSRAAAWAATPGRELPKTLDEMANYPASFRKVAYRRLTPEQKERTLEGADATFSGSRILECRAA